MFTKYGSFNPKRENIRLNKQEKKKFTEKIEQDGTGSAAVSEGNARRP
jgi:hypothetical protein